MEPPGPKAGFQRKLPLSEVSGLRPETWIAVGPGFAREEIKALVLERGGAIVGQAVTSLQEIAVRIIGTRGIPAEAMLGPAARQEALRMLLGNRKISSHVPELIKLKRGGSFWRKLDRSIQSARVVFSSPSEEEALFEKLEDRKPHKLGQEVRLLGSAYEAWLAAKGLWDPPLALRAALGRLEMEGWPGSLGPKPKRLIHFTAQVTESLEATFLEALAREIRVETVGPLPVAEADGVSSPCEPAALGELSWERWHTIDDAAESIAMELARDGGDALARSAVLIPDRPEVRRSLKRALARHGIPEADARDPEQLRLDERVKWALLPLRMVASRFERSLVIAWIAQTMPESSVIEEIYSRGIQDGLESYRGGTLSELYRRLADLEALFGRRRKGPELASAHVKLLSTLAETRPECVWVIPIIEKLWNELEVDSRRLGQEASRGAPLLHWLERLDLHLAEALVPPPKEKREGGIRVYRLQQAPLLAANRVFILGMPANWLTADASSGGYWLRAREREALAATGFAIRSSIQVREERLAALRAWCQAAREVRALDSSYAPDGRERESIAPILSALYVETPEPRDFGASPRWSGSYAPPSLAPPSLVRLPANLKPREPGQLPEISATTLDHYSRCPFQALVFHRWRLRDLKEPDYDLWPDVRGILLHEAARLLIASRGALSARESVEQAWRRSPRGLFRSDRAIRLAKQRLVNVLEVFLEKEGEYQARAKSNPVVLDQTGFRLEAPGKFALVGKPDRVDETADGLFVIDYKTSSSGLPNAEEILGLGYRLQLPFYALAAQAALGKPAIGLQFVSLSRGGSRGSGLFFKRFNGKEEGMPTNVRSNSKSLVDRDPGEVWGELHARVLAEAEGFASGRFDAAPKKGQKECVSCVVADVCGFSRREEGESAEQA